MGELSDKVLTTINSKSIRPRSKWYFLVHDLGMWFLSGLAALIGGLAFSLVILFIYFQNLGFTPPHQAGKLPWFLTSIPYAWLLVFALLVLLVYYNLKHLKRSYKYSAYLLIIASFCGSIVFGLFLASFGVHKKINDEFSRRLPFYGPVFDARIPAWGRPEDGVLAGKVKSINDEYFVLEDFKAKEWKILYRDETSEEESLGIAAEKMVLVTGEVEQPGVFSAKEILPWNGCHGKCKLTKPFLPQHTIKNTNK